MNRRHFLTTAGAAAALVPASAPAAEEPLMDWEKVVELTRYTAVCEQATDGKFPNIRLEVHLDRKEPDSSWTSFIRLFKLTWDGQEIPIPERFWNDLNHIRIEDYPEAEIRKVPEKQRWKLDEELESLKKPRLILSAESGTVLIEWTRGEECDGHSTIRWIVTKAGIVLRHRHEPFHVC